MSDIEWNSVFDEVHTQPGASDDEIAQFRKSVLAPLTSEEINTIRSSHSNPFPESDPLHEEWKPFDPADWTLPDRPFPDSYLSLLRWSNGAECRTDENWFQFFPALAPGHGVRAMLLGYDIPEYLPGFVPFAFDGCGTFYLFDMRKTAAVDEYPITLCHSGSLDIQESWKIAESFLAACQGEWDSADVD